MKKILLFSSLCKEKEILKLVLPSWQNQIAEGFELDILIYNDNNDPKAFKYAESFINSSNNINLLPNIFSISSSYKDHLWNTQSFERITKIKNTAINYARQKNYDSLFLIDADLVLHPMTLSHLFSLKKDFVFELFWTKFKDQSFVKPNCWDYHSWNYNNSNSILKLKTKGVYKTGAGGACSLLSKKAMDKGLNFEKLNTLAFGGEDRHICTRAEVLGIDIFIDTHYPAFHIFGSKLLPEAKHWINKNCIPQYFDKWIDNEWEKKIEIHLAENLMLIPKNWLHKVRISLYKARRAFVSYMKYN